MATKSERRQADLGSDFRRAQELMMRIVRGKLRPTLPNPLMAELGSILSRNKLSLLDLGMTTVTWEDPHG